MRKRIFISYSRKDLERVQHLYNKLKEDGYSPWLDQEDLLPGSDWEMEIRNAIREAAIVIICLSSRWVNDRGYVQNELNMALEAMKSVPEGEIFLIPAKLDDCTVPAALERLHWVNLYEPQGLEKIKRAIASSLTQEPEESQVKISLERDAFADFMEDHITRGAVIYEDPWETWSTEEEKQFKLLLKPAFNRSVTYRHSQQWDALIELWEPLYKNPLFKVDHPEWRDRPFFRFQVHGANCQMFAAFVMLSANDWEKYLPKAFSMLKEVLKENPYSLKGGAYNRLSKEVARVQNLNYIDTLEFAVSFLQHWGGSAAILGGVSEEEAERLERRVDQRLGELHYIMDLYSDEP